jgi:hypothetical protein
MARYPDSTNVYEAYPVNTEWPDPGPSKWAIRTVYLVLLLAAAGMFVVSVLWWPPAGLILGLVTGALFAANVKMSLRPQWPI